MNQYLVDYVDQWLSKTASFICEHMPVDITVDMAYEEILHNEEMIAAFQNAVKYLPRRGMIRIFKFLLDDGRIANIQARLTPTERWPIFLIPQGDFSIDPQSHLATVLATPIHVATDCAHLQYIWHELRTPAYGLTNEQLVYLMPWLRECLAEFHITSLPVEVKQAERKAIAKEHAAIMRDADVLFFPRLSKDLIAVARSGRVLISQHRMIVAAYASDTLTPAPLIVEPTSTLIEPWVKEHLTEAMEEWQQDRIVCTARHMTAAVKRRVARERANPRGK